MFGCVMATAFTRSAACSMTIMSGKLTEGFYGVQFFVVADELKLWEPEGWDILNSCVQSK